MTDGERIVKMQILMDELMEEKVCLRSELDGALIKVDSLERLVAQMIVKLKSKNQELREAGRSQ